MVDAHVIEDAKLAPGDVSRSMKTESEVEVGGTTGRWVPTVELMNASEA